MVNTFSLKKAYPCEIYIYIYIKFSVVRNIFKLATTDQTRPAFIQSWNFMLKTEVLLLLGQK